MNVATRIATGFGLALAVFLAVGAASWQATSELIQATELRRHSTRVLDLMDQAGPLLQEAELATRNFFLTGDSAQLAPVRTSREQLPRVVRQLRQLTADNAAQQQRLAALEPLLLERLTQLDAGIAAYQAQGLRPALEKVRAGHALETRIEGLLAELQREERRLLRERAEASDDTAQQATTTILAGTAVALALAAIAGMLVSRDISRRLRELTATADRIRTGDIATVPARLDGSDEMAALARAFAGLTEYLQRMAAAAGQLAAGDLRSTVTPLSEQDALGHAFARLAANLRAQIGGMVEGADVLAASVRDIVASTSQLAANASQSAAAVAETTATVEEVRQTAELASEKARHVADSAQRAAQASVSGRRSTDDMSAGMERIREQMEAIAASMARLAEHGQTIGQIVATVEDLAAQSNLLAVNAAIEAAKAGEQGRGFGVVAQEVKSLAAQSREATAEVRSILGQIQAATLAAVQATQQGGQAVGAGTQQTELANEAIRGLAGTIQEAAQAATQIAASSQQQLVGVKQVAGAMENVRQASSQNMASARQLEGAARNLGELGSRLKQMVASYQV